MSIDVFVDPFQKFVSQKLIILNRISIFWKLSVAFLAVSIIALCTNALLTRIVYVNSFGNLRIILLLFVSAIFSCGTAWLFIKYFIKTPFEKLVSALNELAQKNYNVRLNEDENNEFDSLSVSFNDITCMFISFQTELTKTKEYLTGILESTADIIITANSNWNILSINIGAEKALGFQGMDVIGNQLSVLFVDPLECDKAFEMMKNTDNLVNFITRFKTKYNEIIDVLLTLSHLRNSSGEIISIIGIGKDITKEIKLQNELIQSQRLAAIGEVFTGVQHSLKNMLNACMGGAYMVRIGLKKDNRDLFIEGWDIVQEGINRMTDVSMDMLKYVKDWKPKLKLTALGNTFKEIDRLIQKTAKEKGVRFILNLPADLPLVFCDGRMIHTAIMDIVSNALDACYWKEYPQSEIPEVVLAAYTNNNCQSLVIEVKDNGCGMSEEVKAKIFTPFFSTKSRSGTGLGLAITARMISLHQGEFYVESEPDQGTKFRILVPIDRIEKTKENKNGKKSYHS